MNTRILLLDQLGPSDERRSGAKAYNCARLRQAGFPVPDGLVVLSTATDADLAALPRHPWFDELPPNILLAVRSSGIGEDSNGQSFAGIHETRLNVCRADLIDAVRFCRASVRSPQAVAYRSTWGASKGAPKPPERSDAIETPILVQIMIHSVASGVAFTINPVTGATDEIVINSSWGLGDELVSGRIDPDEFHVRKHDGEVSSCRIGDKGDERGAHEASLTTSQVRDLASVVSAIERHYGAPQDVEWCHDGAQLWIVQSRPITSNRAKAGETQWTRANLAEVLPEITSPQALAACAEMLNVAERKFLGRLMAPDAVLGPMARAFHGRLYFNVSQLRHICVMSGIPPATVLRALGHGGDIDPQDEKRHRIPIRALISCLPDLARILARHARVATLVRRHARRTRDAVALLSAIDPRALSDDEVWAVIDRSFREAPANLEIVWIVGSVFSFEASVQKICEQVGFPFDRLLYPQLAAGERSVSAQQAFDLVALANVARRDPMVSEYLRRERPDVADLRRALHGTGFLAKFERFLETYGHRGRYESDWALPRYNEDPTPLLRALRAHLDGGSNGEPSALAERQAEEAAAAWRAFEDRLTRWQRWTILPRVRWAVRRIKQYYLWREQCRSDLVRPMALLRAWHLTLADRFVERGWLETRDQYFLLLREEIARALGEPSAAPHLRGIVAERAEEMGRHRRIRMPLLMRESELPALIRSAGVVSTDERQLSGFAVSGGCVEADVVVIHDPGEFDRMKPGAILVARATDPSWTPLFTLAAGVIVEVGGVLSHASTIAREYGLPALANVKDATRRLKTGERVRLDAENGTIYRMTPSGD